MGVLEPVYGSYLWMRRRECCGIFGFGVRNAFYESFMAFNVETPAQSNTLSPPHTHRHTHTRTGSGRHLALTLCGTGVTQSTPTSGLAGVRLDGRCHKRDKDRGAGGMGRRMRAKGAHLYLYCRIAGCAICSRASSVYHPGLILAGHGFH